MNKKLHKVLSFLMLVTVLLTWNCPIAVKAADEAILVFSDIEEGDLVEVYRIASLQEDGSYKWETTVADWITNKSEGKAYKNLTPEMLKEMTEERSQEFCETLISGLKNESNGIANLRGYSFLMEEGEEDSNFSLEVKPGIYMILPKGTDRIYELKWIEANLGENIPVAYSLEDGDYQIPYVEGSVSNITKNRDLLRDYPYVITGDVVQVNGVAHFPNYPAMYASGKRILNITILTPPGMEYVEESLQIGLENETAYSVSNNKDVILYKTKEGEILYFGTSNQYYYKMDGSIVAMNVSEEEALRKYNEKNDTEYILPVIPLESENGEQTEEKEAENEKNTESEKNTENEKDTEIDTEIKELDIADTTFQLERQRDVSAIVISFNTEIDMSAVEIAYQVKKNEAASKDGFYDNQIALSYSVSSLDSNLTYTTYSHNYVSAYGIRIFVREGTNESYGMAPADKVKELNQLQGSVFNLYRLEAIVPGNLVDENEDPEMQYYYDSTSGNTYLYRFFREFAADENGEAATAGIEPGNYLLVQKDYPVGYTLSEAAVQIEEKDWTDESVMEGLNQLELVWLDYKTRYIAATGKYGIVRYAVAGTSICLLAIAIFFYRYYPGMLQIVEIKVRKILKKKKKL